MAQAENTVCLSIQSYNQMKAENTKFQLFISRLWENIKLKEDCSGILFDIDTVEQLMHLIYLEQYKKKLGALRAKKTKEESLKMQMRACDV